MSKLKDHNCYSFFKKWQFKVSEAISRHPLQSRNFGTLKKTIFPKTKKAPKLRGPPVALFGQERLTFLIPSRLIRDFRYYHG